jgi:hypothetical protein
VEFLCLLVGRHLKPGGRLLDLYAGTGTSNLCVAMLGEGRTSTCIEKARPCHVSAMARTVYCCSELERLRAEVGTADEEDRLRKQLRRDCVPRMKRSHTHTPTRAHSTHTHTRARTHHTNTRARVGS